jgi:hypothetical protein
MKSVIELQMKAIDSKTDLNDLLLHAYLIASQLGDNSKLNEFAFELFGGSIDEKPYNRIIDKSRLFFKGVSPKAVDILQSEFDHFYFNLSVQALYAMKNPDTHYKVGMNEGNLKQLAEKYPQISFQNLSVSIKEQQIDETLLQIRRSILDWAILLQSNGILGEEGFFNPTEKVSGMQIIYGDMIYGDKVEGDKILEQINVDYSAEIVEKSLHDLSLDFETEAQIKDQINIIKTENSKKQRNLQIIKGAFNTIGRFLDGIANTAVATYVQTIVNKYN